VINTLVETPIPLAEIAKSKVFPKRRRGKRPDTATIYRWTVIGIRGIRLESIQIGGNRCTSREALQRFFESLTANSSAAIPAQAPEPTPRARRKSIKRAERVLDSAGI
jgi:hypothetical protein